MNCAEISRDLVGKFESRGFADPVVYIGYTSTNDLWHIHVLAGRLMWKVSPQASLDIAHSMLLSDLEQIQVRTCTG